MNMFVLCGLLALLAGSVCIYLASTHQRWLNKALPTGPACISGGVLLLLGWLALGQSMQTVAASFVFVTALMLLWVVLPYVGALVVLWQR